MRRERLFLALQMTPIMVVLFLLFGGALVLG